MGLGGQAQAWSSMVRGLSTSGMLWGCVDDVQSSPVISSAQALQWADPVTPLG